MPYPQELTDPMREELVRMGVTELRTPGSVDEEIEKGSGTLLLFVNSVCGCAAGMARPGLALSLQNSSKPDRVATVFAGVDTEATARARTYFSDYPPSSPQIALFKDGKFVQLIQRHQIEGTSAPEVAHKLISMYEAHCTTAKS
ncbi:MAG: BrxA/BrxB family bacilliredoxin [Candidatus Eisenbacteria bacterium]|uniref:BrxA/BrxB family bacilliredoxin n=1 Tax=Eiseniibacteriota bacterium TaxID=2212470 RepID=A0A956LYP5_UNCEI|nr:BrxA/BrxB family bacilliredoxin [Candidatus Eisenbacteria bacterium]